MKISIHTDIGKRRSSNQDFADYFVKDSQQTLFVLCDGVGGSQAGDIASRLTTEFIGNKFKKHTDKFDANNVQEWLESTIDEVNQFIYDEAGKETHLEGMSTTLVCVMIVSNKLYIAHVGDSRAYIFNDGQLKQMTEDHSLVNELIRSGEITEEEGENHPIRNVVTQSIGGSPSVVFGMTEVDIHEVDMLLMCSDGLTNMVPNAQLIQEFHDNQRDLDQFNHYLIDLANHAGGLDNITVILVADLNHPQVEEVMVND